MTLVVLGLLGCTTEQGLAVQREPPTALISSPAPDSAYALGSAPVLLTGAVEDLPDRPDRLAASWLIDGATISEVTPDTQGAVAGELVLEGLEPGEHELMLRVVDTDGSIGEAKITLVLEIPRSPPVANITAPVDGSEFKIDTPITFTGTGADTNDAAELLNFVWTSDKDGEIVGATSGGGLSFVTAALTEGDHVITLQVTDSDGDVGTDTIAVQIGDDGPPDEPAEEADPGDVIFSELMINPQHIDDEVGEWVELYNTGDTWIDIGGYRFHDLDFDQFTLLGPIYVAPNDYVVLCANTDPRVNGGVDCDAWFDRQISGGLALANKPDEVVLSRPDGVEIDRLVYGDPWVELTITGQAIGVDPSGLTGTANDDFTNWCAMTSELTGGDWGTPGVVNDECF
jgi:hypothetical protein